ncbi:MAG TPA: ester cyclase [Candidatus Limnocylindria bacterium]
MSTDQNKTIARRIVDEAWNKHDPSILDTLFSSDAVLHDPRNKSIVKGPQGAKSTLVTYLKAFPDMKISIEREIAEGDLVVQHLIATGKNTGEFNGMPATGKNTSVTGVMTSKIKDGKVIEAWSLFDSLSLLQQLGVVPASQATPTREPELVGAR